MDEQIKQLYEQGVSICNISKKLHISRPTIYRSLIRLKIFDVGNMVEKVDKENLYQEIHVKKTPKKAICKQFGITSYELMCLIEYYGISRSKDVDKKNLYNKRFSETHIDKYALYNLYIVENKTINELSKQFGVHQRTIVRWLKRYDIHKDFSLTYQNMVKTSQKRYGGVSYVDSKEFKVDRRDELLKKRRETIAKNQSLGKSISKEEIKLYDLIKDVYSDVVSQYTSEQYPYNCDFYIPSQDLYIEYQGYLSHNGGDDIIEPFDETNPRHIERLKQLKEGFGYKPNERIKTWAESDVEKRKCAKNNHLKWLEFFTDSQIKKWLKNDFITMIESPYTIDVCLNEYRNIYCYDLGSNYLRGYDSGNNWNKTIVKYQWNEIYKREIDLWNDDNIKNEVYCNRKEFVNKNPWELTSLDVVLSLIRMRKVRNYSYHSPLWIRSFIEEFGITSIYDPCGGWGHRILGSKNIRYIYNDINPIVVDNCKRMVDDLKIQNKYFYNQDASKFTPTENYECVFTCPPYWNIEKYTDNGAENLDYDDFLKWWKDLINHSMKELTKYFAFVMSYKFKDDMIKVAEDCGLKLIREQQVGINNIKKLMSYTGLKTKGEYLMIMEKVNV